MLEIIDNAIDHSDKIINDLLDYSREMHLELTESTLPTLLNDSYANDSGAQTEYKS